jgi:hypothetical protein
MRSGNTISCGCAKKQLAAEMGAATRKHGHAIARSPEYSSWAGMINRCHNEKNSQFYRYGGRGIAVCDEWRRSFTAFLEHIGPRPSSGHSVDRKDNSRGYEPGNVRWATAIEQNNNMRSNRRVVVDGIEATVAEHIRRLNLHAATIKTRLHRGWDVERAFKEPIATKVAA